MIVEKSCKSMNKNKLLLIGILFQFAIVIAFSQENYPVPEKTKQMLFYFQRSHNKNTIIYELNTTPDGKLDADNPIKTYWIRYEEGGVRKELSYIQRKAFGLQCKLTDKAKGSYILHFSNFKKRDIFLMKDGSDYKAYTKLNGELAELVCVYLKSKNNSKGIPLSYEYVELTGVELKSGKRVVERYIP
jgi:hypothetical protein